MILNFSFVFKRTIYPLLFLILGFLSCNKNPKSIESTNFPLNQPCMFINYQGDNNIEGNYLTVKKVSSHFIILTKPIDLLISQISNPKHWSLGWGTGMSLYNNGYENLFAIQSIKHDTIYFNHLLRGQGYPKIGQNVTLWNKYPSDFNKISLQSLYQKIYQLDNPHGSYVMSKIIYNPKSKCYYAIINKVDCENPLSYLFYTSDFKNWKPSGKQPFTSSEKWGWKGVSRTVVDHYSDLITDFNFIGGKWYFAINTYENGKPNFKILYNNTLNIHTAQEITREKTKKNNDVFGDYNCKFFISNNEMEIFYSKRYYKRLEDIATQKISLNSKSKSNIEILDIQKTGWCSSLNSLAVSNLFYWKGQKILIIAGAKEPNCGWFSHYISKNQYQTKKGNILDIQFGIYIYDNKSTYIPYRWNPILTNDYSLITENDHLCATGFSLLQKDNYNYLFYTKKTSVGNQYLPILIRKKIEQN